MKAPSVRNPRPYSSPLTLVNSTLNAMRPMKTGEIAERADVGIHTVRYYEERGLLPKPKRSAAGYRQYGPEHLAHLHFIKRAQRLGFTLEEIRELLALRATPESGSEVRAQTTRKIDEIDAKIRDLQRIRAKLVELEAACAHHGSDASCRVLHALDSPDDDSSGMTT